MGHLFSIEIKSRNGFEKKKHSENTKSLVLDQTLCVRIVRVFTLQISVLKTQSENK